LHDQRLRRRVTAHIELDVTEPWTVRRSNPAKRPRCTAAGCTCWTPTAVAWSSTTRPTSTAAAPETSEYDLLSYRRPSRHCPSDRFLATAAAEFGEVEDPTAAAVPQRVQRAQ
jgi:hypothetical protein